MTMLAGLLLAVIVSFPTVGVADSDSVTAVNVLDRDGNPVSLDVMFDAVASADVLLMGEFHGDTLGHQFQHSVLQRLIADGRPFVLSLEMFERDVQLVVDEYLAGHIPEDQFLRNSRPWPHYERDYRPLVETAKANGSAVVAANVPRRYVNLVAREGAEALTETIFHAARRLLPPLPLPEPSARYQRQFRDRMAGMPDHGGPSVDDLMAAQVLWDAGMAESIARSARRHDGALVVHVAGAFHVEGDGGIPEYLLHYEPGLRVVTVTVHPSLPPDSPGLADFIVESGTLQ